MHRPDHQLSRFHPRPARGLHSARSRRDLDNNCRARHDPLVSASGVARGAAARADAAPGAAPLTARPAIPSCFGGASRFGDGKPIVILAPHFIGSDLIVQPFSMWLKALGYRPMTAGGSMRLNNSSGDRHLAQVISDVTRRVRRKAILITHSTGMTRALRAAAAHRDSISDVIVFDAPHRPRTDDLRVHYVSSGWPLLHGMVELPRLLRSIGIELV